MKISKDYDVRPAEEGADRRRQQQQHLEEEEADSDDVAMGSMLKQSSSLVAQAKMLVSRQPSHFRKNSQNMWVFDATDKQAQKQEEQKEAERKQKQAEKHREGA